MASLLLPDSMPLMMYWLVRVLESYCGLLLVSSTYLFSDLPRYRSIKLSLTASWLSWSSSPSFSFGYVPLLLSAISFTLILTELSMNLSDCFLPRGGLLLSWLAAWSCFGFTSISPCNWKLFEVAFTSWFWDNFLKLDGYSKKVGFSAPPAGPGLKIRLVLPRLSMRALVSGFGWSV